MRKKLYTYKNNCDGYIKYDSSENVKKLGSLAKKETCKSSSIDQPIVLNNVSNDLNTADTFLSNC